jgi:hypothetical protein
VSVQVWWLTLPPFYLCTDKGLKAAAARAQRTCHTSPRIGDGRSSVPPEILKPRRTKLSVTHRVLNVAVSEVGLQGPRRVKVTR